jgi:hypothetical protein
MAITSLAVTSAQSQTWNCSNTVAGLSSSTTNASKSNVSQGYSTSIANNALGGADEFFNFLTTISAGASATLDLTAMTNVLQQATVSIVRVKSYQIQLLSVAQDASGTACSGITYGALGTAVTNSNNLGLGGGSGLTVNVTGVTTSTINAVSVVAGGTGYPKSATFNVVVIQSTATGGILAATTNSSGVVTAVAIVNGGTGYSVATPLQTFVQSFRTLATGGSDSYFDQTATGFAVASNAKNVVIQNNDGSVAAAVRIQITACTS